MKFLNILLHNVEFVVIHNIIFLVANFRICHRFFSYCIILRTYQCQKIFNRTTLDNYDEGWNNAGKQNTATYRNLPPGDYTFKIHVAGTTLARAAPIKAIKVHIAFPWWATIHAYIVYFLISLTILFIIYKAHLRQVRLKNSLYYEKKLRQQEHDLMEEKMRFYTNFSHELKSPLTLILGPVQDLLQLYATSKSENQLLKMVQKNANLLLSLINRLLEFRKIESEKIILHCAKYDLHALASEEYEFFHFQAQKKGVGINFDSIGPLPLYFDHEKIQIVLNNLLSNAVKFTEHGQNIDFQITQGKNNALIIVRDTGSGMSQKELKSIFSPFYQATNSVGKGGTGIGLALCKSLLELHGADIEVKSKPRKGTTFTVKLPLGKKFLKEQDYVQFIKSKNRIFSEDNEGVVDAQVYEFRNTRSNIEEKTPLMLVVDDNEDIVQYLESIFYKDFKIAASYEGNEGIKHARDLIPDIIISDVMMPQKNGIELCRELKSNQATSHIPIILLTAKDSSEAKVDGFSHGADAYITKPFDSVVLKARVDNLMENRKQLADIFSIGGVKKEEDPESAFLLHVENKVFELLENGGDSVPKLAKELGFSRTSLYRKIKAVTGLSINQFIRKVKIQKAAILIKNENMNVSEVAFSLGFEDLKYFRKCFKEEIGELPSEFYSKIKNYKIL